MAVPVRPAANSCGAYMEFLSPTPPAQRTFVFLLPNLCCASKICSWAASRVEQAKPRSVEKEGGGAGQGSDQTKKGQGERVLKAFRT